VPNYYVFLVGRESEMMGYVLGSVFLLIAVGIALRVNALMLESRLPVDHYDFAPRKKETVPLPVAKLLLFIAVAIVFALCFSLEKTYYNHYLLTLLFLSMGLVLMLVVVGILFTADRRELFSTQSRYHKIFIVVTGFLGLALSLFACLSMADNVEALVVGPEFSTGIVEGKSIENGGRLGPVFYIAIEDERYKVLDYGWWQSISQGDQISFAYNGRAEFDKSIFQPEKISFSTSGILVSGVGGAIWLAIIGISLNGYKTLFSRKQYDFELPMYHDSYAQQGDPPVFKADAERKNHSLLWAIGGGLLTVLIVAWRIFRRATKSL